MEHLHVWQASRYYCVRLTPMNIKTNACSANAADFGDYRCLSTNSFMIVVKGRLMPGAYNKTIR